MNLPGQLNFFEQTTPASTSVVDLRVILQTPCRECGSCEATTGSSRGPHHASLHCSGCAAWRGWMSGATHQFVSKFIDIWGRPETPIIVRQSRDGK